MDSLVFIIGFILLCFLIIVTAGFCELKLKKKNQPAVQVPTGTPTPDFVEGRIYQMEDGSFAKYVGNGKFLKIKQ